MNRNSFKLNGICLAMVAATSTVSAQQGNSEEVADDVELIQVTGIRSSLSQSASIKQNSNGIVDAISAEDIGKLPDTNLAESLQRISGVSIDRANNEGNKVTVRGFGPDFNLVTLNGRQMPNSSSLESEGIGRSFNFREIASESVSGVNVYKTGRANVTSGGIGATIDIKTAKPFDFDGFTAFANAQVVHDTSVNEGSDYTPELSGMISQTFNDGNIGLLLSVSHSKRESGRDRVGTDGWVRNRVSPDNVDLGQIDTSVNPTQAFWVPWTATVETFDTERERQNAQVVLQFQASENVVATLDYTLSRFEEVSTTNRMAFWFDNPTGQANENGTLFNPRDPDDELNFWAWEYFDEKENDSLGLNVEWQATESLTLTFDAHDSTSHANPDGTTAETLANLRNDIGSVALIGADFIGEIPSIIVDDSNVSGGAYNPDNIFSDLYQQRGYEMENNIQQASFAGKWENLTSDTLESIEFGVSHTDYTVDTFLSTRFAFVDVPLNNLDLSFVPLGDTADQFSGTDQLFPLIPQYDVNQFVDIVRQEGQFQEPNIVTNGIGEKTLAAFLSFNINAEFNDIPMVLNVGVRYEDTDVTAYSIQPGIVDLNYRNLQEVEVLFDTEATPQELEGNYTRILPNLDFSAQISKDVKARFSYSTTLARAGISAMFPSLNINNSRPGGPFIATQGNPNLLPITSSNLDFSIEWYDNDGSYASVGYFKKFVENFIGAGTENRTLLDINGEPLRDPSANPREGCPDSSATPNPNCLSQPSDPVITWEVSTPDNIQNRVLDGWEFNVQYMFAETGFGAIANYTLVDSDEAFDPYNFDQTIALAGLSDSGNLVGFYENEQLQVRLAYNWRDDFLLSLGNEPTFTEAYGQWDLSISYAINDTYSLFFDGLNLTDETVRRHGRFAEQLLSAEQYGPRYSVGISARW